MWDDRITLAQSVPGSIPVFTMQLEQLPVWVHKEIDRAMRRCVWGKAAGKKGMQLLNWETFCKPKKLGKANLKLARDTNHALLAKMAWRVLTSDGYA